MHKLLAHSPKDANVMAIFAVPSDQDMDPSHICDLQGNPVVLAEFCTVFVEVSQSVFARPGQHIRIR